MPINGSMKCNRTMPLQFLFFFNDTATTEIYTLSLHDALPICVELIEREGVAHFELGPGRRGEQRGYHRSEEHTSELQSPCNLVCRLLLEKKNTTRITSHIPIPLQPLPSRATVDILIVSHTYAT